MKLAEMATMAEIVCFDHFFMIEALKTGQEIDVNVDGQNFIYWDEDHSSDLDETFRINQMRRIIKKYTVCTFFDTRIQLYKTFFL